MSDVDAELDLPHATARHDVVLITDASAEGEVIASALRARGFAVLDVPLALLEARVASEAPKLLIIDVDQRGAVDAVERVRDLAPEDEGPELICVGDFIRAAELGASTSDGTAFQRPVDVGVLVEKVATIASPMRRDYQVRGTTPPPSYAPRRESQPPRHETAAPREEDSEPAAAEGGADPLDPASILPGLDDGAGIVRVAAARLSPELEDLLTQAELRVGADANPSSVPAPEEEVDLVLSADLLQMLDEPLEPDDEDVGTGSGASATGTPMPGVGTHPRSGTGADLGTHSGTSGQSGRRTTALGAPAVAPGTGAGVRDADPGSGEPRIPDRFSGDPAAGTRSDEGPPTEQIDALAHLRLRHGPVVRTLDTPPEGQSFGFSRESRDRVVSGPPLENLGAEPPLSQPLGQTRPTPPPPRAPAVPVIEPPRPVIPAVLGEGDAIRALARAVSGRASGALAVSARTGLRRVVLHDGDIVTAGSGIADEALVSFLAARGDVERDVAVRLAGKLPPSGRHAGAALIAHGHLGQDDLWPVLRSHAEWIIGRMLVVESGTCELEDEPPGRLRTEPSVFGGATGAEVLVETLRRVLPPETALRRLGGLDARLDDGPRRSLVAECALRPDEEEALRGVQGRTIGEVLAESQPELANVLYALASLDVLAILEPAARSGPPAARHDDPLDDEAVRQRVRARMALVEEGDYFALLGIARQATSYEIKRAYLELRRLFEPARLLTARTADLADDVRTLIEVLDEAFEILREPHRRDRYRRAIEAGPPP